ncbi:MAG TPA: hypothetical protein PLO89_11065, partial [Spirochaetota bacterium]|nr:hypothetical protein [Spirochaetota bacterium]
NYEEIDYIYDEDIKKMKYITEEFKEWLKNKYEDNNIQNLIAKFIEIRVKLNLTSDYEDRKAILNLEEELFA